MKFLADMGISLFTVRWLRERNFDAMHLREENLQRLPDEEIFLNAKKEERIILTMDLDFGYIVAISKLQLPSVILFRLSDERSENVNKRLEEILDQCSENLERGAIISVNDTSFRVRSLPLK
ncbi:MAG: DUF5615 family PIN-like protein [Ignavibacteriales bacterium]|nr:DUF5615 family PIN-like protein [Ignavibacteriales bacterium]